MNGRVLSVSCIVGLVAIGCISPVRRGEYKSLDTAAIQSAIDAAGAAGGGRVSLESGVFRSGTIYLKSKVELHVAMGAKLLASDDLDDYNPTNIAPWNGGSKIEGWSGRHLLMAVGVEDVAITGEGTIDGNGRAFFDTKPQFIGKTSWRDGGINAKDYANQGRPGQMLEFVNSRNIRVRDVAIVDSPCWSCFFWNCDNVQVRGLRVENDLRHLNTDGVDIDSCRNVTVSDCVFVTGDDAIAIRGAPARLDVGRPPCENITVANCVCTVSATGVRVGVGTGIIRHVRVSNLVVEHAGCGIHVQRSYRKKGGVDISDVAFSGVTIRDTAHAIRVIGGEDGRPSGISFSDIDIEENDILPGEKMVVVEQTDAVTLSNVRIHRRGGVSRPLQDSDIKSSGNRELQIGR